MPGLSQGGGDLVPMEQGRAQQVSVWPRWIPTSPTELPGDTSGDWLRHLHTTLECLWHELNLPMAADTHVPTPAPPWFVRNQRPP